MEIVPLAATYGEDAELSSQAASLARKWLKDHQSLDPDMVGPVLSIDGLERRPRLLRSAGY